MSGKSRGYAAAFQQLDSIAETYQMDNPTQHYQQPQQQTGVGNQAFLELGYHAADGYPIGNGMQHNHNMVGMPQHQQTHHALLMPNHHFQANNNDNMNNMNSAYQLMFQNQQEQQGVAQVMPYYGDVGSSNYRETAINNNNAQAFAGFDPLPMQFGAHQRTSSWDEFMSLNSVLFQPEPILSVPPNMVSAQQSYSSHSTNNSANQHQLIHQEDESWLSALTIEVSGLSMEPMLGTDVVQRCQASMDDVTCRYIPCVDFLVQCQQELRKGQRLCANKAQEFFLTFIQPLPRVFYGKNQFNMSAESLQLAMDGLHHLVRDAKGVQRLGSEAVKNHFLGGMKDGESWGLRKWLSKHGNALPICTNLECILTALRKLDKSAESTRKLATILRPMAHKTLQKLQTGVPESYQEQSSAHPYLPFFHRLEAALRSMSQFEPEKDDVICLDDSDDEDEAAVVSCQPQPIIKRRRVDVVLEEVGDDEVKKPAAKSQTQMQAVAQHQMTGKQTYDGDGSSSGESEDDSVVEIVNAFATASAQTASDRDSDREWSVATSLAERDHNSSGPVLWPLPVVGKQISLAAAEMAANIDRVAEYFDSGQQAVVRPITAPHGTFWEGHRYARVLRLFSRILRQPEAVVFIERVDEDALIQAGHPPFSHVIKHPLSLRDIAASLIWNVDANGHVPCGKDGELPVWDLRKWNMWKGMDLLQAIDLVFLNSLAYGRRIGTDKKSNHRSSTNKLRKLLWDEINRVIQAGVGNDVVRRKSITPTRRSESSGFVVYKIQE
ncbi:hypothetical protein MPSEU_000432800 [Mayamaea pseudoterrestris]|nr:hypothetical protein MPSEU_000432800 [Mayamaea pseudoterrestris]